MHRRCMCARVPAARHAQGVLSMHATLPFLCAPTARALPVLCLRTAATRTGEEGG